MLAASLLCPLLPVAANAGDVLSGAGATFPAPLYQHWFDLYLKETGVRISYNAVGSGAGISMLLDRQVDFCGTDSFLTDEDLALAPADMVHIPTCIGAVAVICNLPGLAGIKLPPDVLADLLRGKLRRWNAPAVATANPGLVLPDREVVPVHRSDASGTTFILSDFLAKTDRNWATNMGRGQSLEWPGGYGVKGSAGVVEAVGRIPGAIGYAELAYTVKRALVVAAIRNARGEFVLPTPETAALAASEKVPADTRHYLTNSPAAGAYPLAGFTWLVCYADQDYASRSPERATQLARLLHWLTREAQTQMGGMTYAPLPPALADQVRAIVDGLSHGRTRLAEKQP